MEYLNGKIIKAIGGFYYCLTESGTFCCRAKGKFRKDGLCPVVGDNAKIMVLDKCALIGNLEEILPRKSLFARPPVANIDMLVITVSAKEPMCDFLLTDKLSVIALKANVNVCVCVNKTELDRNAADEICKIYSSAHFPVVKTSTKTGEGINELKSLISGKICAFAGNSGVGKSSLLRLITERSDIETGEISEKIKRGKNTTRHSELIPLKSGGAVLDTPGFSSFYVDGIKKEELQTLFPEIKENAGGCRFAGCAHINEPDCSVKLAADKKIIHEKRYENYKELYNSLKNIKEWMK